MEEDGMSGARWTAARLVGAGVLGGLALAWMFGGGRVPTALAAAAPAPVEANGTLAFTSGVPGQVQWLYLIDTKAQAFAVYSLNPQGTKGTVKLEAARQYRWDLKLAEYNNQPPQVAAIESMVGGPSSKK
jgi:hypothetical protein